MLEIEILTSPDCKPCEVLRELLVEVLDASGGGFGPVALNEVDVIANPETVLKYGILATPALAINGKLRFTGVPRREELLKILAEEARVL
jgi:thiol-disulfide isomerase/thioredoxin